MLVLIQICFKQKHKIDNKYRIDMNTTFKDMI